MMLAEASYLCSACRGFVSAGRETRPTLSQERSQIVLNPITYPNFLRFLRLLQIPLLKTDMTFSVTKDRGRFEWAGEGLGGLFCQWTNLYVALCWNRRSTDLGRFNPRLYRMIFDVLRFNLFCLDLLKQLQDGGRESSIGEYLERDNYGPGFKEDYLLVSRHLLSELTCEAYDCRYLVYTCRSGRFGLSSLDFDSFLPQPSSPTDHRKAKMDDHPRRLVR